MCALTARACGDVTRASNIMNEARSFARQSYDDMSVESLAGFILLGLYWAGTDVNVWKHYGTIAASIFDNVSRKDVPAHVGYVAVTYNSILSSSSSHQDKMIMFAKQAKDLFAPSGPAAVCAGQMRLLSKIFSQTPNFSVTNCRSDILALTMCQLSFNDVQREAIVNEINEYRAFGTQNVNPLTTFSLNFAEAFIYWRSGYPKIGVGLAAEMAQSCSKDSVQFISRFEVEYILCLCIMLYDTQPALANKLHAVAEHYHGIVCSNIPLSHCSDHLNAFLSENIMPPVDPLGPPPTLPSSRSRMSRPSQPLTQTRMVEGLMTMANRFLPNNNPKSLITAEGLHTLHVTLTRIAPPVASQINPHIDLPPAMFLPRVFNPLRKIASPAVLSPINSPCVSPAVSPSPSPVPGNESLVSSYSSLSLRAGSNISNNSVLQSMYPSNIPYQFLPINARENIYTPPPEKPGSPFVGSTPPSLVSSPVVSLSPCSSPSPGSTPNQVPSPSSPYIPDATPPITPPAQVPVSAPATPLLSSSSSSTASISSPGFMHPPIQSPSIQTIINSPQPIALQPASHSLSSLVPNIQHQQAAMPSPIYYQTLPNSPTPVLHAFSPVMNNSANVVNINNNTFVQVPQPTVINNIPTNVYNPPNNNNFGITPQYSLNNSNSNNNVNNSNNLYSNIPQTPQFSPIPPPITYISGILSTDTFMQQNLAQGIPQPIPHNLQQQTLQQPIQQSIQTVPQSISPIPQHIVQQPIQQQHQQQQQQQQHIVQPIPQHGIPQHIYSHIPQNFALQQNIAQPIPQPIPQNFAHLQQQQQQQTFQQQQQAFQQQHENLQQQQNLQAIQNITQQNISQMSHIPQNLAMQQNNFPTQNMNNFQANSNNMNNMAIGSVNNLNQFIATNMSNNFSEITISPLPHAFEAPQITTPDENSIISLDWFNSLNVPPSCGGNTPK